MINIAITYQCVRTNESSWFPFHVQIFYVEMQNVEITPEGRVLRDHSRRITNMLSFRFLLIPSSNWPNLSVWSWHQHYWNFYLGMWGSWDRLLLYSLSYPEVHYYYGINQYYGWTECKVKTTRSGMPRKVNKRACSWAWYTWTNKWKKTDIWEKNKASLSRLQLPPQNHPGHLPTPSPKNMCKAQQLPFHIGLLILAIHGALLKSLYLF